jgi:hypothetical protein
VDVGLALGHGPGAFCRLVGAAGRVAGFQGSPRGRRAVGAHTRARHSRFGGGRAAGARAPTGRREQPSNSRRLVARKLAEAFAAFGEASRGVGFVAREHRRGLGARNGGRKSRRPRVAQGESGVDVGHGSGDWGGLGQRARRAVVAGGRARMGAPEIPRGRSPSRRLCGDSGAGGANGLRLGVGGRVGMGGRRS